MTSDTDRDQAASWRQRARARERGDLPLSRDFSSTLALLAGLALLSLFARDCWLGLEQSARGQWQWSGFQEFAPRALGQQAALAIGRPFAYLVGGTLLMAFGIGWIQTGCGFFWARLQWDLGRLNPTNGWNRIQTPGQWASAVLGLIRGIAVVAAVGLLLWQSRDAILAASALESHRWLAAIAEVVFLIVIKVAAVLGLLALLDFALQRWLFERRIAMSPEEIHQELRTAQIDPYVVNRRRSLGRSFVHNGIVRRVRSTDLIVADEARAVVGIALSKPDDSAPTIALRAGAAQIASIKHLATRLDVPVVNHSIASMLFDRCRVDAEIPQEFLGVVKALARSVQVPCSTDLTSATPNC